MPEQRAAPDVAVLVGVQAAGKSTFYRQRLADRYELVSKDLFPRGARNKQRRQMALVAQALAAGRPVAVDNTNPSPEEWGPLVAEARAYGATATAYWFPPDVAGSLRRNAARQGRDRVPDAGFRATLGRLRVPSRADGFDAVLEVRMDGRGGFTVRPAAGEPPPSAGRHPAPRPGYPPTNAQDPTREGGTDVTVPEENRPKTTGTDEVIESTDNDDQQEQQPGASGRSMREAMEEAGVKPEDYEE
ncbi:ATP-binding protein [Streptomyces thermolilacinus]